MTTIDVMYVLKAHFEQFLSFFPVSTTLLM